jgi:Leucine-rich repeat (LRR) protein
MNKFWVAIFLIISFFVSDVKAGLSLEEKIERTNAFLENALDFMSENERNELRKEILKSKIPYFYNKEPKFFIRDNLEQLCESLTWIKELHLDGCQLKKLPQNFGNLNQLEDVILNNNEIETLPDSFMQLYKAKYLDLSNNNIKKLPKNIDQLISLNNLNLNENKIRFLPKNFTKLSQLKFLDLSDNELVVLPEDIEQLNLLTNLDIGRNNLVSLPDSILQLNNLIKFWFSKNKIKILPDGMDVFEQKVKTNLRSLDSIVQTKTLSGYALAQRWVPE